MAQMERVSWRTVGYSMLGAAALIGGTVGIVRSDGVRPTSLKSNSATRWLVDKPDRLLVLADGLTGRLLARISTGSDSQEQQAYQGLGGAFLVVPDEGSVRAVSTAKLQLGSTQKLAPLAEPVDDPANLSMGVGPNGLTVVNTESDEASLVGSEDAPRPIDVPKSDTPLVARDGSMWLFDTTRAVHINADGSGHTYGINGKRSLTATVGPHAVYVDAGARTLHWIDGGSVDIRAIPNLADAIIQQPRGEDGPCVWIGSGNALYCVGKQDIEKTVAVKGLVLSVGDRLAVAGNVAVIIHRDNRVERVDLGGKQLTSPKDNPKPGADEDLTMIAVNGIVWIDETAGHRAWSIHDLGVAEIVKNDASAGLFDAQGQEQDEGTGDGGQSVGGGNVSGPDEQQTLCDTNEQENSPVTVDDQVTARAGSTIIIPVTANDYDPDCPQAIALYSVGLAGHGIVDVLDGTSVSYRPSEQGYSGTDRFDYTIVDEAGNSAQGIVNIELFPPGSPNRPPITRPNHATTSVGRPVVIDVLANDIDPERDLLSIPNFDQPREGTVADAQGPSGLPALRFTPPAGQSGRFTFTYQAADPQGGTSANTPVTVDVAPASAGNEPPSANPDAIRLKAGVPRRLNVMANDTDPDGDDLTIRALPTPSGVTATVQSGRLELTLQSTAPSRMVVQYELSDGTPGHEAIGRVLVLRVEDVAPNRPPVANPDADKVVLGSTVKIPVLANDSDPEGDTMRLLSIDGLPANLGTAVVEGDEVRFTPTDAALDAGGPITFTYRIDDGHNNPAIGTISVTVLAQALPKAPIANNDQAETTVDTSKTIDVLSNDTDPSGGKPSLLRDVPCNDGTAEVTSDQRVTYTPPKGKTGLFRCRYSVSNTQSRTAQASIFITVDEAPSGNTPPRFNPSALSRTVQIGDPIVFTANGLATDDDGDTLTIIAVSKPNLGTTTFGQPSTTFTYSTPPPNPTDVFPLSDSFTVQVSDGHTTISEQVSVKINDKPPTPVAPSPPKTLAFTWPGEQNTPIVRNLVTELTALNPDVKLTLSNLTAANSSQVSLTWNSNGDITITPKVTGPISLTYSMQSAGGTSTNSITVTVAEPPPNPPVQANDDVLAVSSGGTNFRNLLTNDTGYDDPGDTLNVSLDQPVPSSFGTVSLSASGTLTLTANANVVGGDHLVIPYTLRDGHSVAHANVNLSIDACTESPPQTKPDPFLFTPYQTPIFIDLSKQVVSGTIDPASIHGAITTVTGTYTPPAGENSLVQVLFEVTNACHQRAQGSVTIDVNRAPTAVDKSFNLNPAGSLTVVPSMLASDDEPLVFSAISGQPDWVSRAADGSSIGVVPPSGVTGTFAFLATVSDPGGLTATATITLTLNNQPPTALDDVYRTTESLLFLDPSPVANDSDPEGQPLTIRSVTSRDANRGVVQSQNGNTVMVSVAHGVSVFDYTITDPGGQSASAVITVISNHAPTMPDASGETNQSSLSVTLSPTDADAEDLGHLDTACMPPNGWDYQLLHDPATGPPAVPDRMRAYFTVAPGTAPGVYAFPCTTTDPLGASGSATITITIDP